MLTQNQIISLALVKTLLDSGYSHKQIINSLGRLKRFKKEVKNVNFSS